MSYADVTAHNAHQTPEEARANPVPSLEIHDTTSTVNTIDVNGPHIAHVPASFEDQDVKTDTQAERIERETKHARAKAEQKAKDVKSSAKKGGQRLRDNQDNPVVLGNAVLGLALFGALGYGGYVKYRAGEFGWKVVGIGMAVLGAFGVADFYASQYLFKKYPAKK